MPTVAKAVLNAHMLEYFRQVEESGEPLIVTSHRKPVLRVEPIRERRSLLDASADLRGKARGTRAAVLAPGTEGWGDV
jgi:antitoxin (DNA-binding transcriptional repressor) of toxin-antitoxin stability system